MSDKDLEKSSNHVEEVIVADENQVVEDNAHRETALDAIRNNPWQVAWCVYALWVLTLSSYDNQAGGVFLSIPQFRKDFGYAFEGNYVLQSNWQSAFSGGPTASAIIGAFGSSYLADRIGRKLVYLIAFLVMLVGITLETVATTNPLFFAGKFINGFAVGAFGTITVTYIGEISPHALRGAMTAGIGISFTFGPFLVTLLTNSYGTMTTRWAYRGIFVSQYAITFMGMIGLPFMPESPWWLITTGKTEKAIRSLRKLGCPESELQSRMDNMRATLERSKAETEGVTFSECFKKSNLRRTLIAIAPISIQALAGVLFIIMYASYYIQLAGYSASTSFKISIASIVLAMLGNISSWFIVDRVGRRALTLWGLFVLSGMLMACGGLGIDTTNMSNVKGVIGLMTAYSYVYNITIGATAYNFLAEVSTSRLRAKTASIGLAVQSAIYTMFSFILPYIFNPDEANLGAKTSFIFGGLSLISLVAMWLWMPETSRRTYRELDEMFANHVPARKFKEYDTTQKSAM